MFASNAIDNNWYHHIHPRNQAQEVSHIIAHQSQLMSTCCLKATVLLRTGPALYGWAPGHLTKSNIWSKSQEVGNLLQDISAMRVSTCSISLASLTWPSVDTYHLLVCFWTAPGMSEKQIFKIPNISQKTLKQLSQFVQSKSWAGDTPLTCS